MGKIVMLSSVVLHRAETINAMDVDVIEQRTSKSVNNKNFTAVAWKPARK
jgi:hypothetical protein